MPRGTPVASCRWMTPTREPPFWNLLPRVHAHLLVKCVWTTVHPVLEKGAYCSASRREMHPPRSHRGPSRHLPFVVCCTLFTRAERKRNGAIPSEEEARGEPSVLPGAWVRLCAGQNHLPLGTFDSCGSVHARCRAALHPRVSCTWSQKSIGPSFGSSIASEWHREHALAMSVRRASSSLSFSNIASTVDLERFVALATKAARCSVQRLFFFHASFTQLSGKYASVTNSLCATSRTASSGCCIMA